MKFQKVVRGLAALAALVVASAAGALGYSDPALTGATHLPGKIAVNQVSTLNFTFGNNGQDDIPVNTMDLLICGSPTYFKTDGVTPPGGVAGGQFSWVYQGASSDCWRGTNTVVIPAFTNTLGTLNYTGLLITPAAQSTTLNIEEHAGSAQQYFVFEGSTTDNSVAATLQIFSPMVSKSYSTNTMAAGASSTLTFLITASSTAPATTSSFTDALPSGLRLASPSVIGGTCANASSATSAPAGGNTVTVTNVNVAAGQPGGVSCTITVNVTNVAGQTNAACASNPAAFTNGPGNLTPQLSSSSTTIVNGVTNQCLIVTAATAAPAYLVPTKTASVTTVAQNGTYLYSLSISNNPAAGSASTAPVTLRDDVPAGVTITSVANTFNGWTCGATPVVGPATLTCTKAAAVAYPTSNEQVATFNATKTSAGSVTNTVTVTSGDTTCPDGAPAAHCVSAVVVTDAGSASLSLRKTASVATIARNGTFTYTVSIDNAGTVASSATTVTDQVPAGVTINSLVSGAGWSCTPTTVIGAATITCTRAAGVAAATTGQTVVTLNATKTSNTAVSNVATITEGDAVCPRATRCVAVVEVTDASVANLVLTKTASVTTISSSETNNAFTYTIGIRNTGTAASGVNTTVTDTVPAGITITGLTNGAGWSCTPTTAIGPATITCVNAAGIAANASGTVVTLNATKTAPGSLTGTATSNDPACVAGGCSASVTVSETAAAPQEIAVPVGGAGMLLAIAAMLGLFGAGSMRRRVD